LLKSTCKSLLETSSINEKNEKLVKYVMIFKFKGNNSKSLCLHVFFETFHQQTGQIHCKDKFGKIHHQYMSPTPALLLLTK